MNSVRSKIADFTRRFLEQYLVLAIFSVIAAMLILFMTGVVYFNTQITITDGDSVVTVLSKSNDVDDILAESGIEVGKFDVVSYAAGNTNDISEITINRAFEVPVTVDGDTRTVYATEIETVGLVLNKAGVTLDSDDEVNYETDSLATEGMKVVVKRIKHVVETKTTAIPFETETIRSSFYKRNTENVMTEGVEGELTTTAETTYVDGVLSSFNVINEEVTREPVTQVIAIGTAKRTPKSTAVEVELDENGIPVSYSNVITGRSAAYSARSGARGASGKTLYVGTVAVNPNIIPYGTEMYIVSTDGRQVYGHAVAADTGLALMDGRAIVDVFMDSYSDSCSWGAPQVNIYILD